jgi:hypothetical protein
MKVVFCLLMACALHAQTISGWVFGGPDHRLHYLPDARGNTIMDFSAAGYGGGGVRLPSPAAAQRLTPVAGDNTSRIQAALDSAKGAVVLAPGEYEVGGTVSITHSGVVLRGEKGAAIRLTGKPHCFLEIRGAGTWHEEGPAASVLDAYVPAGTSTLRVRGASMFHPGDHVLVLHPLTAGGAIRTDRVVEEVDGDRVTLDVPLSDALDSKLTAASLVRYSFPGRIAEVGVEGLRIAAASEDTAISGPQHAALEVDGVDDAWVRDLEIQGTENGIAIGPGAKRITVENVGITHAAAHSVPAAATNFALQGTQILIDRCRVTGDSALAIATGSEVTGPVVILNFTSDHGGFAPQQPWATGVLVDSSKFGGGSEQKPGLAFSNRATAGPGSRWDMGWSVAWNVNSPFLLVPQPPGALNWCIGCMGTPVTADDATNGIFDALGKPVVPPSLYLYQLKDRLGPEAISNIGYTHTGY